MQIDSFGKTSTYKLNKSNDLDPLMDRVGERAHVLLGEASHGTHEYYSWRIAISKRLILEKDFQFIAVEGDWPDCYKINRFIKGYADQEKTAFQVLKEFNRWPTWMWANWEIVALIEWLKMHNEDLPEEKKVGFYGLDVYSLWESLEELVSYLSVNDQKAAKMVKEVIACFEPFGNDEQRYARAHSSLQYPCQQAVIRLLEKIRLNKPTYNDEPEASLNILQNAKIAVNAEDYYRNLSSLTANTWNMRDQHMMETYKRILDFYGASTKAIIWAHNTHIGDARYTDMIETGDINIGQLIREQKGDEETVLVGFGSYEGSVIAGKNWDAEMKKMALPPARPGSVEYLLHQQFAENRLLIFDRSEDYNFLDNRLPHRAIGVVYHPEREEWGNYVPSKMNSRYDVFLFLDQTQALHPLHIEVDGEKLPETFPFNF